MSDKDQIQASRRCLRGRGGAPFVALGLALASFCSGGKPASAAPLPTVTIGKAVDTIPFTVLDVAIDEGFFKKNGVNAKEELVDGSSVASAAMVGGSLQFTCEAAVPLMLARARGIPIVAVDALDDAVTLQLIVAKTWLTKHPIPAHATLEQKMADLNGSVLAQIGTTDQAFYGLLRNWAGLPEREGYRVEQLNSLAAVSVAVQKGLIDVTVQSPPASIELAKQGYAEDFVDRRDVKQFDNVAYDLLTTTASYAKEHPQITKHVATAIAEALDFMRDHPNQTLAIEQKYFPKLSKSVLQQSLQFIPFAKDGMQSQKGWDSAVQLALQMGLVKGLKSAPEGVYWTNQYIDASKLGH